MRVKELENEILLLNTKERQMEQEISEVKKNLK
jgi:hypothetical protein